MGYARAVCAVAPSPKAHTLRSRAPYAADPNRTETKRNDTKRNETKRSEAKRNETYLKAPSPNPLSCSGSQPSAADSDPTPQAALDPKPRPPLCSHLPPSRALFRTIPRSAPRRSVGLGRLVVFSDTTQTEPRSVCAGWEPMRVAGVPAVPLECPLSEPRRPRVSCLRVGIARRRRRRRSSAGCPPRCALAGLCSFVCLFVCMFRAFVCGGPVRSGRARAGTSPARSEGPLGTLGTHTQGT